MIIKDNMANMCAKVTSTYMEFTLAFGPKPEFSFSFKSFEKKDIKSGDKSGTARTHVRYTITSNDTDAGQRKISDTRAF